MTRPMQRRRYGDAAVEMLRLLTYDVPYSPDPGPRLRIALGLRRVLEQVLLILTEEIQLACRDLTHAGVSQRSIADQYGMRPGTVQTYVEAGRRLHAESCTDAGCCMTGDALSST